MMFSAIIPAAGSGSRSGSELPKQYVELLGRPVLSFSLALFASIPECLEIVVAIDPRWRAQAERAAQGVDRVRFVDGGAERQHSIAQALALLDTSAELVLVHDAARPCLSRDLVRRVLDAASRHGAALPVLPLTDTIKQIDSHGVVTATIDRTTLRAAQTPQGFRVDLLRDAYRHAADNGIVGTDDASLVEALGHPVMTIEGERRNIKITVPEDFRRAEEAITAEDGKQRLL